MGRRGRFDIPKKIDELFLLMRQLLPQPNYSDHSVTSRRRAS
jgi:hypothetical protein